MLSIKSNRAIATWIFIGVGMLIIQVLLGGLTRLTGSGLSITEWKPIMGALPPMNESEWQKAFEQYQQIAQYKFINRHFTLGDFKFIFFWEWFHRLWARLIGVVFLIPFIYFLVKKYIRSWMVAPLVILFLLGALQGFVGWIMVKSGINDTDVYVSHIRLAAHFMAAMVLIVYALWFGLKLVVPQSEILWHSGMGRTAVVITLLIVIQLVFGAYMAGLKAAMAAPTWPDINRDLIPANMFSDGSILHNLVYNKITIHFVHRTLAYIIAVAIFFWWWRSLTFTNSTWFNWIKFSAIIIVTLQVVLGILTLLNAKSMVPGSFGKFEWYAQLHQLFGMLLLLNMVTAIYLTRYKQRS
jgi:heme a synthase